MGLLQKPPTQPPCFPGGLAPEEHAEGAAKGPSKGQPATEEGSCASDPLTGTCSPPPRPHTCFQTPLVTSITLFLVASQTPLDSPRLLSQSLPLNTLSPR